MAGGLCDVTLTCFQDPSQLRTCDVGEACLFYSWRKSPTETSVIRECFPTSVLLGSIEEPVEPQPECSPMAVESDTIMACICTNDFCSGIEATSASDQVSSKALTPAPRTPAPVASRGRTRCHQCGSLFSSDGNPSCERFDPSSASQAGECREGEACLWYSWERSQGRISYVRECFSTSILLGTISSPLEAAESCIPRDISETSTSARISACLCTSDLCNSYIR